MKEVEIGKGVKLTEGDDIAILSIGHIGNIVADAVEELKAQGMKVAHYDMVFLKPLDESILHETGSKYKAVITVEDGTVVGGLGTAVSEWYCEHGYNVKVRKIGIPDSFIPHGTVPQLYELCGMDNNSIKDVVLSLINN